MESITLETLPKAFMFLLEEVKELKSLLKQNNSEPTTTTTDQWFDLKELCAYLPDKPKPATVYGWVFTSTIPVHKGGKKLRFLKSEIDQWLLRGKVLSIEETALEVAKLNKK